MAAKRTVTRKKPAKRKTGKKKAVKKAREKAKWREQLERKRADQALKQNRRSCSRQNAEWWPLDTRALLLQSPRLRPGTPSVRGC